MRSLVSKIFFSLCLITFVFILQVNSSEWHAYWVKAVEKCHSKDWNGAMELFNKTISIIEFEKDFTHPHVYVDRARLYLILENWEMALIDVNRALSNDNMEKNEKIRALLTRISAKCHLGQIDELVEDYKLVYELYENKPIIEETEEYIIIRNVPECSCYVEIMTAMYISMGKCKSQEDVKLLDSKICIIKKTSNCNCGCKEKNKDNESILLKRDSPKVEECKNSCDRVAVTAQVWCGSTFKFLRCQAACALTVEELRRGCYWCCSGDGFYQNCVKPFEDICKYIKEPCDPAWD